MLLKPLTIATAGLAAASTAFLIPSEVSDIQVEATDGLQVPKFAERQHIDLPCPNCPLQLKSHHGKTRIAQGLESHLELDFVIDHAAEHDRLLLNGLEIYPSHDPKMGSMSAPHVADLHGEDRDGILPFKKLGAVSPKLGFSVRWSPLTRDFQDGMDLISLDFQIFMLGRDLIDSIPHVTIKLIQTSNGAVMIANTEVTESQVAPFSLESQVGCTTILCRWRAILDAQVKHMKPHHKCDKMGKLDGHRKGPHHHHHHTRPHFRLREHSWSQLLRKFTSHILLPILVGVVAGVSVSIIGMVVGTLIVGLWRVFVRGQPFFRHRHCRRRSGHAHHRAAQKEIAYADEKSGLMADQDEVPAYEDDEDKKVDA